MKQKTRGTAPRDQRLHRTIWYMGAKARVIPGFLEDVLRKEVEEGGTVVDLMAGTGVVSAFCADRYRVLSNDVQLYSSIITSSLVEHDPASKERFLRSLDPDRDLGKEYRRNFRALERLYRPALEEEERWIDSARGENGKSLISRDDLASWADGYRDYLLEPGGTYGANANAAGELYRGSRSLVSEDSIRRRRTDPREFPACLCTAYYANIYFGLRQSLEIDSLRAAIEALDASDPFLERKRIHYLSALLHAASVCTSGTSHFAQPRHLTKPSELAAMARRRLFSVFETFEKFHREIVETVAHTRHRRGNSVTCRDYRALLRDGGSFDFTGSVDLIYMDPPYTADNYSRFYHVLEVLARYDYPELQRNGEGAVVRGRYPLIEHRFRSGFCRPGSVEGEFRRVITEAAASGAKLVISYSSPTGLLLKTYARKSPADDPVARLEALCRESYRRVRTLRRPMTHSGQGDSVIRIEELLVVCKLPK